MASVFSRIIQGEMPAQLVWDDESVVAFLDANPITEGHTLVVPRREVDQWTDLADREADRLFWVARQIGIAQVDEFECVRAGLVIAGYHVPHVHLHVFPTISMADFDFTHLGRRAQPSKLDRSARRLRSALSRRGLDAYLAQDPPERCPSALP